MTNALSFGAAFLLLSFAFVPSADPQSLQTAQVHVQGAEAGQGVLRGRGNECFVVTPTHVVDRALGAITIVGDASIRAQSQLERRFAGDVAVLRAEPTANLPCAAWSPPPDVDAVIAAHASGFLLSREGDGSLSRMPVALRATDTDSVYVRPSVPDDRIAQTMSGSSLVVGTTIVGILLSVEGNEGRVFQIDNIDSLTSSFFSPSSLTGKMSRELLQSLTGEYDAGSIVISIGLRADDTLTSQSASTAPVALLHERDLRFKVEADPRVVFEFRRDGTGEVAVLLSHQPNGIVPAVRRSNDRVTAGQLRSYAGTYHAGDATFIVGLDAQGILTFNLQGHPHVQLQFARDRHFVVRGSGGAYVEFVRGPEGVVTGLILHQGATPVFASRFR